MGMLGIHLGVDTGPGLTKQSFRDEVDINRIVASFEKTGVISNVSQREPFYGDVSELGSYQEAINVVQEAERLFAEMPAEVRRRFDNDPSLMLDFLSDEKNKEEAIRLGMVTKPPVVPNEGSDDVEPTVEPKP